MVWNKEKEIHSSTFMEIHNAHSDGFSRTYMCNGPPAWIPFCDFIMDGTAAKRMLSIRSAQCWAAFSKKKCSEGSDVCPNFCSAGLLVSGLFELFFCVPLIVCFSVLFPALCLWTRIRKTVIKSVTALGDQRSLRDRRRRFLLSFERRGNGAAAFSVQYILRSILSSCYVEKGHLVILSDTKVLWQSHKSKRWSLSWSGKKSYCRIFLKEQELEISFGCALLRNTSPIVSK